MNGIYDQLVPAIRNAGTIMLCTHIRPDGDAIGSILGLGHILLGMNKNVTLVSNDGVPSQYLFLPHSGTVVTPAILDENITFDLAIALDAADESRIGETIKWFKKSVLTAQIDHHETNPKYAGINIVDSSASSTGNMIIHLAQAMNTVISKDCALCLYTSISTDTGNFCFANVCAETFSDMSMLMEAGLDISSAAHTLHLVRSRAHVLLLGCALKSLRFLADGQISLMNLTNQDFLACSACREHSDRIVNYGLDIDGVKITCLAEETVTGIKFSLRALPPYSVSQIAGFFGGGGHALAAGCHIEASVAAAYSAMEKELLKQIESK